METGVHYPLRMETLPSHWRAGHVGDFAREIEPGFASGEHNQTGEGVAHLRPMNIDREGKIDLSVTKFVSTNKDGRRLAVGDVLFNNTNSPELVGKTAAVSVAGDFAFSNHMTRIRFSDDVLPKFGALQLHFLWMRGYFKYNCVKHVNQASVSSRALARGVPFVWAPPAEQEAIVAEIEKQFSRLDEAVANLKRVKDNLKRYKAAVLKAAVEGRLAAGSSTTSAESGARLPLGWRWANVGELAKVGTGATPSRSSSRYWQDGDIPWVTSAAVNEPYVDHATEYVTRAALAETNLTLYPPGTFLVAMYGEGKTRGKCTELRIAATTNQALAALQTDPSVRPYLKLVLEHSYEDMRKVAAGGVQPNLNLSLVRSLRVPLPPHDEQRSIVAEVDRRLSIVREVAAEVDANLKRAQALQQAVLSSSFQAPSEGGV